MRMCVRVHESRPEWWRRTAPWQSHACPILVWIAGCSKALEGGRFGSTACLCAPTHRRGTRHRCGSVTKAQLQWPLQDGEPAIQAQAAVPQKVVGMPKEHFRRPETVELWRRRRREWIRLRWESAVVAGLHHRCRLIAPERIAEQQGSHRGISWRRLVGGTAAFKAREIGLVLVRLAAAQYDTWPCWHPRAKQRTRRRMRRSSGCSLPGWGQ